MSPRRHRTHALGSRATNRMAIGLALLALVWALAGCGAAQDAVDAVAAEAERSVAEAAQGAVEQALAEQLGRLNVPIEGRPSCAESDINVDVVNASVEGLIECEATTTGGEAVAATFNGRISATSCEGTGTITVPGREPIEFAPGDVCRLAGVVGGAAEGSAS